MGIDCLSKDLNVSLDEMIQKYLRRYHVNKFSSRTIGSLVPLISPPCKSPCKYYYAKIRIQRKQNACSL